MRGLPLALSRVVGQRMLEGPPETTNWWQFRLLWIEAGYQEDQLKLEGHGFESLSGQCYFLMKSQLNTNTAYLFGVLLQCSYMYVWQVNTVTNEYVKNYS